MADGGRAETIAITEIAARMLAASFGTGNYLAANVREVQLHEGRGETVMVAWRGSREESAARGIRGSTRAPAMHAWACKRGVAALPSFQRDPIGAAALAGVEAVPAALLRVYALEQWSEWGLVERAIVHATGYAEIAARDAMARILWRTAEVAKSKRAKQLGMRGERYLEMTNRLEVILRRWLRIAARQYLAERRRLSEARKLLPKQLAIHPSNACGFTKETWWHPERLTPRGQQQ